MWKGPGRGCGGPPCVPARALLAPNSTFCSGNSSGRGAFIVSLAAPVPMPIASLFFFFFPLFGCENDSGYQTASGFGPWNAFASQKARKLPRITKRQVRTMAFRKQPYYSAQCGLWRGGNNWISDFEYCTALHDSLNCYFPALLPHVVRMIESYNNLYI